jgi:NitT/TauT family transport system ATP-binding protein
MDSGTLVNGHRPAGVELRLDRVSLGYAGGVVACREVSLSVRAGGFFCLVGPSGCGKSSLLRMVAGLTTPSSGAVSTEPALRRGDIGIVFQDPTLLAWRDARSNVELPLQLQGIPQKARTSAAESILRTVGLGDALTRLPRQLSGGMKMRVALARAAVCEPKVMLLDEPFAAVDEMTRERLQRLIVDMWLDRQFTAIFVTHSVREAVFVSERVGVMTPAPGRLSHVIDVPLPFPRDDSVRTSAEFNTTVRVVLDALHG